MTLLENLAKRELIVVTGKGGVGKSIVSAALGSLIHQAGRRVLLLEVDPRENLHRFFSAPPAGGEVVNLAAGLFLEHLSPRAEMDELVREHLRIGLLVNRVLASPVYEHFAGGAPGLKELAVLGHALRAVAGPRRDKAPRVDTVVLDAPATGHSVSLLAAPSVAANVIRQGPFGRMARTLESLVADPGRCAVVVVTLAEEMPVQEAIELIDLLHGRLARRPDLVAANCLYPPAGPRSEDEPEAVALWRHRRGVNERELRRLRASWDGPLVELPLVAFDHPPELLAALAAPLAEALSKPPGALPR
ncbi:MAG: ArsA family ATPase [Acidobacteriota bacterium]